MDIFHQKKKELKTFALSFIPDMITYTLDHIFSLWFPIVELVSFLKDVFGEAFKSRYNFTQHPCLQMKKLRHTESKYDLCPKPSMLTSSSVVFFPAQQQGIPAERNKLSPLFEARMIPLKLLNSFRKLLQRELKTLKQSPSLDFFFLVKNALSLRLH